METREFKGKKISLLGFGLMRLPLLGESKKDIDLEASEQMVDLAMRSGVNYYDTAWPYHDGASEPFAGRVLSRYPRDSYFLASKIPPWKVKAPEDVDRLFAEQLRRCNVDYFDFYLIHSLNRDYYRISREMRIYENLREKKEQGLIRHLGFSFHDTTDLLRTIVSAHDWDFAQIQLNYVDWERTKAGEQYAILTEKKIPVIVMEPVLGGVLAEPGPQAEALFADADPEASAASWAIRYAASLPGVLTVLSGMSALDQVEDNLKTMRNFRPVSDKERAIILEAATAYRKSGTIPCTACGYCMECPAGVDIPRLFSIYNHYCMRKNPVAFNNSYRTLKEGQEAHNCIACGECLERCPQGIDIPARMGEIMAFAAERKK